MEQFAYSKDFISATLAILINFLTLVSLVSDYLISHFKDFKLPEGSEKYFRIQNDSIFLNTNAFNEIQEFELLNWILKVVKSYPKSCLFLESGTDFFNLGRPGNRETISPEDFRKSAFKHLGNNCSFGRVMFLIYAK